MNARGHKVINIHEQVDLETFCFACDSRVVVYKMLACCMLRRGNDSTAIHTESK